MAEQLRLAQRQFGRLARYYDPVMDLYVTDVTVPPVTVAGRLSLRPW
ncbi:hypothetical protein [Streptomyces sp. NBC_01579]